MCSIYVSDIVKLCGGRVLYGDEKLELSNFCIDTRKLNKGDIYVGIVGENSDGNDYYRDAVKNGASCLILSKVPTETLDDVTVVIVDDTLESLQRLASYKRSLYDIPVIAVTGSVGKTSTKDIIYSVVSKKYRTHKTSGNYNNHLGVPLTILSMPFNAEALVVEMGMNHFGELSLLSNIAKPTIAVITNIGTAHIGNLGSREGIRKAKLEILDGMIGKNLIVNGDDDMLAPVIPELATKYQVSSVSINGESTYRASNVIYDVFSSKFDINDNIRDISVNVGGKAYVYNSLVAYAVGKCLDIDDNKSREGILEFKLSASRLEKKVTKNGVILIDDTYNANYDSMKSSIELLGKVSDKRRIAILGDMLELGEYANKFHTDMGDVVFNNNIDKLITIGQDSKLIAKRAIELGMNKDNIYSFDKENECYQFLDKLLNSSDIVLLKASHGIHLIGIVDYLMNK